MIKKQTTTALFETPDATQAVITIDHLERAMADLRTQLADHQSSLAHLDEQRRALVAQEQTIEQDIATRRARLAQRRQRATEAKSMMAVTKAALADLENLEEEIQPSLEAEFQRRLTHWARILQEEETAIAAEEQTLPALEEQARLCLGERDQIAQEMLPLQNTCAELKQQIAFLHQRRDDLHRQEGLQRQRTLLAEYDALRSLAESAERNARAFADRMVEELAEWPDLANDIRRRYAPTGMDMDGLFWEQRGHTRVLRSR